MGVERKMDMCKIFAQIAQSKEDSCILFEELLDEFFDEYRSFYKALKHNGFVNDVTVKCKDKNNSRLELSVTLTKNIVSNLFVEKISEFLNERFSDEFDSEVYEESKDTVLIIFTKR